MARHYPRINPVIQANLTAIRTSDGIDLSGIFVEPVGRRRIALIWVHGLTSSFDRGQILIGCLSRACRKRGIGYFKFNTRGHHLADIGGSAAPPQTGASFERFQDCRKDIDTMIKFARHRGYRKIILAGHSTGANKIIYYQAHRKIRGLIGVIIASPVNDIAGELKHHSRRVLDRRVMQARRWAKRQPHRMVPSQWGPWSASRYVSLYAATSPENVFPYDRPASRWFALRRLKVPLLVAFGEFDDYLDRPADQLIKIFRSKAIWSKRFTGATIPNANHGFKQSQRPLTQAITRWLRTISPPVRSA